MVRIDVVSAQEKKSMETRGKILDATERLLSEYDFKYLTVRNICAEAGAAYGSFYHHFQNKENLLCILGRELLEKNIRENPCPHWIHQEDFAHEILWHIVVLAEFCTAMGKPFVGCVYRDSSLDFFDTSYDSVLIPILRNAHRKGYIKDYPGRDACADLIKDIRILYQGILMWWCGQQKDEEPLAATLEHLLLHMITERRTKKAEAFVTYKLLTDCNFREEIHISGITVRKAENERLTE